MTKMKHMTTLEPIIKQHPFFQGFEKKFFETIVGCASNVRFHTDDFLLRNGEDANYFYLIREGEVVVETHMPGKGSHIIQTVGPGEILGWSWLISPYRYRFDGRALKNTLAIAFDAQCLRKKCEADNHLGYEILKRLMTVVVKRLEASRIHSMDVFASSETNHFKKPK